MTYKKNKDVIPTLNVWSRMLAVWTNASFLKHILYAEKDKAVSRTWFFWFVWNSLFAMVGTVAVWFLFAQAWVTWLEEEWWSTVPAFEAQIEDGVFSTNLPQPYVIFDEPSEALVVIDTEQVAYTEESLSAYPGGLFLTADKFVGKKDTGEYQEYYFNELEEDVFFSKADVEKGYFAAKPRLLVLASIVVFVGIWIWLCLFRLISAAWWALLFWGVGAMAQVPGWTYGKSYLSVLNFYVIALVFESVLLGIGVGVLPFSTLLVFGLVFGVNFYSFKAPLAKPIE